jgi:hypothetical protein
VHEQITFCSSVDRHLSYFYFWAITSNVGINIHVQDFLLDKCFLFLLGIYLWVELLYQILIRCLITTQANFCKGATLFYIPTSCLWRFQFLYILTNTCLTLVLAVLVVVGVTSYSIVVLICTSLNANYIEHLFKGLVTCISSLEKCLFGFFAHFKIRSFVFPV